MMAANTVGIQMLRGCSRCLQAASRIRAHLERTSPHSVINLQQTRSNTRIMERKYPLPAGKDGGRPNISQMNELYKILREVEIVKYPDEISCILTDFVEGVGIRGDIVSVKRDTFHDELYPASLAVYASPENIKEFEEERKAKGIDKAESRLGVFARMAMKELNHLSLEIPMNDTADWTLTRQHVQVALRTQGIEAEEDCLVLPEDPVTSFQDLTVQVWINGLESVEVKAKTVPISETGIPISRKVPKLKE